MRTGSQRRSDRSKVIAISIVGTVLVIAYAALAAAHILVLNPLAAIPGTSLDQIWAEIDAFTGTSSVVLTAIPLGLGIALAIIVLVLLAQRLDTTPLAAAFAYLGMLALGAPAVFMASFPTGMDLADTFLISGAPYAPWVFLLYGISVLAMLGALALAIVAAARQRVAATVAA